MKKVGLLILLCSICFVGCSKNKEVDININGEIPETSSYEEVESESLSNEFIENSEEMPISVDFNSEELVSGNFKVSFTKECIHTSDKLNYYIDLTIYDYPKFNKENVESLEPGNEIKLGGAVIVIFDIDKGDNIIHINGGLENGGYDLFLDEDGFYYDTIENDQKNFESMGDISLLVSTDFKFIDNSDLDNPNKEYSFEEFLNSETLDFNFTPYNTEIKVVDNQIVEINRHYIP